ncbi:MAG TPA: methyl-accepting chemotaxis protein [Candidatus Binatia bacterium]|nr:methyl-accepting chemotaxis protein [Candidatus Binatia bacterium]
MRHLRIWQKLAAMGLVFSLPFAAVTYTMVSSVHGLGINGARAELDGLEYQAALLPLLRDLQQLRGLSAAALGGDASLQPRVEAKRGDVEHDLQAVKEVDARLRGRLGLAAGANPLAESVQALLQQLPSLSLSESWQRHTQVIADLLALVDQSADRSRLTLDPESDSHPLMVAAIQHGPPLAEALAQARGIGTRVLASRSRRGDLVDALREQTGRADWLSLQLAASLQKAFAARPDLAARLGATGDAAGGVVHDGLRLAQTLAAGGDVRLGAGAYFDSLTASVDAIYDADGAIFLALQDVLRERIARLQARLRATLVAAGAGLLLAALIALYISRDITRPLRRVMRVADEIADGDLSVNVTPERRSDEIGVMSQSFDRMVAFLREMVHVTEQIAAGNLAVQVKPQSARDVIGSALSDMVRSLAALVGQVQKSGIQVAGSVNQIAATSKQQQATASEIAATTLQIGATSKEIAVTSRELLSTVGDVARVAEQSAQLAGAGQTGLAQMGQTMRQVVDAASAINAKLAVLNEKAGNIGQVITTISKVADQTNLLSLNAAIEAEKAGEYGRGFSVVATEIRRLADQTAVATYDIEQMVKEIQSAVSAGVMGMDKFSEEVRRGMHDMQEVGEQLSQIIQQVQALAPRFEQVNEGMQAQSTGAEQITQALTQLNEAAQQTVESLRQSTQAIDGLNEVSGGLRSGVSRFRLLAAGAA